MKKVFTILVLLYTMSSNAQEKISLINSGELIKEGVDYHEEEKYDKAIIKFKQVPENDTNYTLALYELGLSYEAQKDYPKAIETYEKALKLESTFKTGYIQQLGNSYSSNKQLDKALEIYRNGLKEFPYFFRFYAEMGAACFENNKPKEALIYLDSCLKLNFFHARAHYLMGQICEKNNYFVPAILSYQMASYLGNESQIGLASLIQIEKIANGEIEINKDSITILFAKGENNFEDIDEIIRSKSELNEKYKVKPDVKLPYNALVKSLHLVNNRLNLSPDGTGWYYNNLVPIYLDWWKKEAFALVAYRMASVLNSEDTKKMYSKNKAKIEKQYADFYNEQMEPKFTYKSRLKEHSGEFKHLFLFTSDNLYALMPAAESYDYNKGLIPKDGYYIYYYNNGMKKNEGSYENGEAHGIWHYYTEEGVLLRKVDFISADEFTRINYYSNGQPESKDHFKEGKNINDYISYFPNGVMKTKIPVTEGEIDGKVYVYYDNGQLNYMNNYENGKLKDGEETIYHRNGAVKSKIKYKDGKMHGDATEYYDDGKTMKTVKYKEGLIQGNMKEYHRNGTLMGDYNYSDGLYDGSCKKYYDNGVMEEEANYAKGENKGKSIYYDFDGKAYAEYVENKGKIKSAIYYNKEGKKIYEVDAQKNELNIQKYNEIGILIEEGKVKKDFRVGKWKFYTKSGALNIIKEYDEKGNFNGKIESYVAGDILNEKYDMKNNRRNGYYVKYFSNGTKRQEGFYVDGEKEGVWRQYYVNGSINQEEYFTGGEREGNFKYYYPNGKIKGIEEYKDGLFYKLSSFDITGKLIGVDTISYPYGNLILNSANGKVRLNFIYKNGKKEGKQYIYWANGNIRSQEEYKDGVQINTELNYSPNGKLRSKYKYNNGEKDSTVFTYYDDGTVEHAEDFKYDESSGTEVYYHQNGKIEIKGANKYDEREGWFSYYSSDGNLQYKILYHMGIELAYSYLGKTGKDVDSIPFKNASGEFTSYFQNGTISAKGTYVNGERNGLYTRYFSNGKKESECTNKFGWYDGLLTEYYENGKVRYECSYTYGYKNGIEKEFDLSGKLTKETTWEYDDMNGPQKIYSNGKLVKTLNYFYDDTTDK